MRIKAVLAALVVLAARYPPPGADNRPVDPVRIADRVFYVGASDIASYLIATPAGHILIDAGYDETVPLIQASVATLGFKLTDVKYLLNTQAHFDHAAGLARMKRLTGAQLVVSAQDAPIIEHGGRGDFHFGDTAEFPAAAVDRRIGNGDRVQLGDTTLTAYVTPGHTKGCTTWTFDALDRGRTRRVVVVCGVTILDGTRLTNNAAYPEIARDYARTFETLAALPCDIFLGAHPSYYNGKAKWDALRAHADIENPFVDPEGYRAFVARAQQRFEQQLAGEK